MGYCSTKAIELRKIQSYLLIVEMVALLEGVIVVQM
jgi:hypothetical protein